MNKSPLSLAFLSSMFAMAAVPSTQATLLLHYSFDSNSAGELSNGTSISNLGVGPAGAFTSGANGGSGSIVTSGVNFGGNALRLSPADNGHQLRGAPHIAVSVSLAQAGLSGSTPYTMMAWVNFDNRTGDNMIFGQLDGATLHHGSRNGNVHFGQWGDDLGPDQGFNFDNQAGTWHHVAYVNEANQNQSIYWDGVLIGGPDGGGSAGGMDLNQPAAIGTANNGGSFAGLLDEVRIYDSAMSASEIQSVMTLVPEPATATFAGLLGLAGLMVRRRRATL